jgi:hypothetical protein
MLSPTGRFPSRDYFVKAHQRARDSHEHKNFLKEPGLVSRFFGTEETLLPYAQQEIYLSEDQEYIDRIV